ncbi:tautomerase family protein [Rathayibacter soli]|uniref:tautomerase family protein n=1 Tax=Rathayibacter soli TaxID=3144168 RepID=UPI0027E43885|nr:tautomerase family protein [Glaciibacter superstes]
MPLIQVDLDRALYDASHDAIGDAIHDAQIEALGIPADDRFQVFRPRETSELKFDHGYNGVDRQNLLLIQVTAVHMYPVAVKRRFFESVVAKLAPVGIRAEDVLISLVENGFEDWFAGK